MHWCQHLSAASKEQMHLQCWKCVVYENASCLKTQFVCVVSFLSYVQTVQRQKVTHSAAASQDTFYPTLANKSVLLFVYSPVFPGTAAMLTSYLVWCLKNERYLSPTNTVRNLAKNTAVRVIIRTLIFQFKIFSQNQLHYFYQVHYKN